MRSIWMSSNWSRGLFHERSLTTGKSDSTVFSPSSQVSSFRPAVAVAVAWSFVLEGMLPGDGLGGMIRDLMPFVNGLAWYQSDEAQPLPWSDPAGLIYFLVLTLLFALIGVWLRRNETLRRSS